MKRTPTNVAMDDALVSRLRIVAAKNRERVSHLIERILLDGLPQEELQAMANEKAAKKPAYQRGRNPDYDEFIRRHPSGRQA
jgi:hypothetical protein